jgi:Rrf2 family iron-sulfur cluster assembly transcriptional regulator
MEYNNNQDRCGRTAGLKELPMKITNRSRYALRATLALAQLGKNGEPVPISSLSEHEQISPVFLEQIFFRLRKAGIVASVRGAGGGFYFDKPLDQITLKAIMEAAGEEMATHACHNKQGQSCGRQEACLSHGVWATINNMVNDFFMNITLASILDGAIEQLEEEV